jgi:hypothetical protein
LNIPNYDMSEFTGTGANFAGMLQTDPNQYPLAGMAVPSNNQNLNGSPSSVLP